MNEPTYEIEDFSLSYEVMQPVHDFFNACCIVPPMYIENVDVMCPKLLETGFNTDLQGLCVVSGVVGLDFNVVVSTLKIRCVLKKA